VGKTVLALAVARRVAERFPGGVAWVPVDPHATAAELLELVGAAPSLVPPADAGAAPAAGRPALLLLDGVDRAPAEVRAVLARLPPGWRVLTSGRAPLGVPGERIWPVSPLEPPGAGGTELAEVAGNPAVALFLDRLARVRPQPPAADEVPALVGLVRRLGGLPLALELTAVPGRVLRLPEILQRYGERAPDPAGPDQPALRQAVAGSYRLLCPVEQQALRRLSAFRGWWSLELAEQLLAGGPPGGRGSGAGRPALGDPVPVLDRLAGLGLLTIREAGEHRFRLLDAVRDYATEQAWRRGESAAARRAHATVLARLVARTAGPPGGPDQPAALARLDEVGGEVWAALDYATADDPAAALELAATLSRWWRLRGRDRAGRHRLRTLLDDPRTAGADPAVRAWAGVGLARLALGQGQGGTERAAAEAALTEFRRLRDVAGELTAASVLSAVCQAAGRFEEARAHAMAALGVASRHGRTQDAAQAQVTLAWHEIRLGDLTAARRRLAAADRWTRQAGAHGLRVPVAAQLAEVARLERRYDEAVRIGHRVLARLGELGDPRYRQAVLGTVGRSLVGLGRLPEAEQVLARLRAPEPPGRPPAGGVGAAIEAELALARGDRPAAVRWWMSAVDAFRLGEDPRELVEALVGLAGCLDRPGSALAELDRVCRSAGVVLLAPERAVVKRAARATSRR
jgi:tetratricopeptide (TPR) repeat protein